MPSAHSWLQVGDWGRGPGQQGHANQTAVAQLMGKVAAAQPVEFVVSTGELCLCVAQHVCRNEVPQQRHRAGSSEHATHWQRTAVPGCHAAATPTRTHAAALLPPPPARMLPPCCRPRMRVLQATTSIQTA